jgi:uncharacterized protein (DUF983 family)
VSIAFHARCPAYGRHEELLWGKEFKMPESQAPSPFIAGLTCRCPACGKGRLFENFLTVRPRCEACGLDFSFADAGDGPAIFVMLFGGFIVVGAALLVEVMYRPPYWVHAALWVPLILLVTLAPLRSMKGLLIALQFHHKAAEGRHERQSGS